jgi:ribonuclease HI
MVREHELEKLTGSQNYHTWEFQIRKYLQLKKLSDCITDPVKEKDAAKLAECEAIISLAVDKRLIPHIRNAKSASEVWKTLERLYADTGLTRRVGLLRSLMSTRYEGDMNAYLDMIMDLSNKLAGTGFEITDEWLTAIILAGLSDVYKPFIMSIEASGTQITSDLIMSKLLDNKEENGEASGTALHSKSHKKKVKCFNCGKPGHYSSKCRLPKKEKPSSKENAKVAFLGIVKANGNLSDDSATALVSKCSSENVWVVDSGASRHMTPHRGLLANIGPTSTKTIASADDTALSVIGSGQSNVKIGDAAVSINDVLLVPKLSTNLLSVYEMAKKGNILMFDARGCTIKNANNETVCVIKPQNGIYMLKAEEKKCLLMQSVEDDIYMWHRKLGHTNIAYIRNMLKVNNINAKDNVELDMKIKNCETCSRGKLCRKPFNISESKSKGILELVHSDLAGPMEETSLGGARYFLTFIDDYSKKVFVYFIKSKSEVFGKFMDFKNLTENQMNKKIKKLRTDNGTEYGSKDFEKELRQGGIIHELSCPYTPQQNGVAERINRTLVEKARCMMIDAGLPKRYWAEATSMAAFIYNATNTPQVKGIDSMTPDEKFYNVKTDISRMKIFGSKIMVHNPKRKKWDQKAVKMIYVGPDPQSKGYRCADEFGNIRISRDVKFLSDDRSIDQGREERSDVGGVTASGVTAIKEESNDSKKYTTIYVGENEELKVDDAAEISNADQTGPDDEIADNNSNDEDAQVGDFQPDETSNESSINEDIQDGEYQPDETSNETVASSRSPPNTRSRITRFSPFNMNNFGFIAVDAANSEPVSVEVACKSKVWHEAMSEELESHRKNGTWMLTELPENRKPIKSKWVFKVKRNEDGKVVRYKARLVAKGFSQKYGIDYDETYSPVVRYTSLRMLIAIAVNKKFKIYQMDAVSAFLQGELKEVMFMEQPEGFEDGTKRVCKLNRAIYGLKQAGRQWNEKLDKSLRKFGLVKSKSDPCVYYMASGDLYIAVYVDDVLIFFNDETKLIEIKTYLSSAFEMKDLGLAKGCIGVRIRQGDGWVELDQENYIVEILKKFGMTDCKPVGTPSDTSRKLSVKDVNDENSLVGVVPYQELIGSLLFLTQTTRPDIAYAVNDTSRFNSYHAEVHWVAVKRILRYLSGTRKLKLRFSKDDQQLIGFTDADWGSDPDKRRSCTGFVFKMANAAISWCSKRQQTVALSSTEAEYMALSSAVSEAIWLKQFYYELVSESKKAIKIYCDNESCIKLAKNGSFSQRTKHIDMRHHFIKDHVENGDIILEHLTTKEMVADQLTKAVTKEKCVFCTYKMGLIN